MSIVRRVKCAGGPGLRPTETPAVRAVPFRFVSQSACFNCHAVDKQKVGPAWHDVAVKYKGNPEAEEKIVKQLTTGKVQLNDGKTGEHATAKTKDPEAVKNLASWILSL